MIFSLIDLLAFSVVLVVALEEARVMAKASIAERVGLVFTGAGAFGLALLALSAVMPLPFDCQNDFAEPLFHVGLAIVAGCHGRRRLLEGLERYKGPDRRRRQA